MLLFHRRRKTICDVAPEYSVRMKLQNPTRILKATPVLYYTPVLKNSLLNLFTDERNGDDVYARPAYAKTLTDFQTLRHNIGYDT